MGTIDELIDRSPHLGYALAALDPADRERFFDGLDSLKATCRSGRDSLVVLALVYSSEAQREGADQLASLWSDVAEAAGAYWSKPSAPRCATS